MDKPVQVQKLDDVTLVTLSRPEVRNAVDDATAHALFDAFVAFEADDHARVIARIMARSLSRAKARCWTAIWPRCSGFVP